MVARLLLFGLNLMPAVRHAHVYADALVVIDNAAIPLSERQIALAAIALRAPLAVRHQVKAPGAPGYVEGEGFHCFAPFIARWHAFDPAMYDSPIIARISSRMALSVDGIV
jgi:hypothetical protein